MPTETPSERVARIVNHLRAGGKVMLVTYARGTIYDSRHVDSFRATEKSAYVRRGRKNWDCIDFTPVKFSA